MGRIRPGLVEVARRHGLIAACVAGLAVAACAPVPVAGPRAAPAARPEAPRIVLVSNGETEIGRRPAGQPDPAPAAHPTAPRASAARPAAAPEENEGLAALAAVVVERVAEGLPADRRRCLVEETRHLVRTDPAVAAALQARDEGQLRPLAARVAGRCDLSAAQVVEVARGAARLGQPDAARGGLAAALVGG